MNRKAAKKRYRLLEPSLRGRGQTAARRFARRPAAPSAGISDEQALDELCAEMLAARRKLTAADEAHTADRDRVADLERHHDHAKSKLERGHRRIQRHLGGFFRRRALALAGIAGPAPGVARELVRRVDLTIDFLRRLATAPPPFLEPACDVPAMAAELEDGLKELEATASALEGARAAVAVSRSQVEAATADADRVLLWSARLLKSLRHLA